MTSVYDAAPVPMADIPALAAFLAAQLDEAERVARAVDPRVHRQIVNDLLARGPGARHTHARHVAEWEPGRVLDQLTAARRHLARWEQLNAWVLEDQSKAGWTDARGEMLSLRRLIADVLVDDAQVYAGQPGWREEWAV